MLMSLMIIKKKFKFGRLIALILITVIVMIIFTACGRKTDKTDTVPVLVGLTSIEAEELAWTEAKKVFGDAVLWRLAPIEEHDSTTMRLHSDWQHNDLSAAWFVWYADPVGENWFMVSIQGKSIANKDIGTRSFSTMSMDSNWPRQHTAISMKDAAAKAKEQGANLDAITWVEFTCDYKSSDFRLRPLWVFECSESLDTGGTLNYRVFVDAITGTVAGAINDRDERMTLPIDIQALQKPRTVNHENDLRQFFSYISKGNPIWAVRQLAYQASSSEAIAQQWLANFQSLKSLTVVSVEQVNLEQWTEEWESYKVTLDVTTSEPLEKYGWENGRNVLWVTLIPQGGGPWKVSSLAQSP
jgi:hypothetical protein